MAVWIMFFTAIDSDVAFLWEEDDTIFGLFAIVFCL